MFGITMPIIWGFALALCGVKLWDQSLGLINLEEKHGAWFFRQVIFAILGFLVISLGSGKFFVYKPFEFIVMIFFTPVILYFIHLSKFRTNLTERWIEFLGVSLLVLSGSVEVSFEKAKATHDYVAFAVSVIILVAGAVVLNSKISLRSNSSWFFYLAAFGLVGLIARGAPL